MTYIVICTAALLVSGLTLFSGFGLGTLLMPAFAIFFPVHVAVAATAVVHGANNIFKILVVGKNADRDLVLRFGIPAILAAFAGAALLGYVSGFGEILRYSIGSKTAVVTPIKLVMGILMFGFAMFELLPVLRELKFDRRYLFLGGLLSGFFGGLSVGFMVDMVRIATYALMFFLAKTAGPMPLDQWPLVVAGIIAAFAGVMIGKRWMHKITMSTVQWLTGFLLLGIAVALGTGII